MRQVAALAGVSTKTVSRVVNGESYVSEDVIRKVREAIRAVDYHASEQASALRRADRQTRTLGLLVGNVANPFDGALQRAVEEAAVGRGLSVFASSLDEDPDREKASIASFLRRRVDGLILTTAAKSQGYLAIEQARGTKMVFVDREPTGVEADVVMSDNFAGAERAAEHLLVRGHRNIAFLGDKPEIQTARERLRGFRSALAARGVPTSGVAVVEGVGNIAAAASAATALLDMDRPPTAFFSSQNLITMGLLHALRQRGSHHSVAVVGFDDLELADLLVPGLTVVAQDPTRIGALAAQRILMRIDGSDSPPETIVVPTHLILRGSGEIPPSY